jgi:hypothetical protein
MATGTTLDFITLEEEQLFQNMRMDEIYYDFTTLEEEQLPLIVSEELQEINIVEQDLDYTNIEMIMSEYVDDININIELIFCESTDPYTPPNGPKRMVATSGKMILNKLI